MPENNRIRIALDALGGDAGLAVTLGGACDALAADPDLYIEAFVGEAQHAAAADWLQRHPTERLDLNATGIMLAAGASVRDALRQGTGSSLGQAISAVAEGRADGLVSAGHTGALLALGGRLVGLLPGVERPALMTALPNINGETFVLDLGANLTVSAEQLAQFAMMGSAAVATAHGVGSPRVGLLNVGEEHHKGHKVVQRADELLRDAPIHYVGFVEGHDLFNGRVDVAVCDGFSGNLILKSTEGAARMLFEAVRGGVERSWRSRLGGWLARPALARALARFDPAKHNGAPLLGLAGVLVKSHGNATREAMVYAIGTAAAEARACVPKRIGTILAEFAAAHSVTE